ncbi:MAG: DUF2510 domain-containing protein [Actinomycetota bacterium]|nr:DUF2510 domain-containing protein [Actinomycetota bacterium]
MSEPGTPPPGAIEVETGFIFLAFLLYFFKTRVVIDGQLYELPWGKNTFPVHPGRHRVRVSFKYLIPSDAGANEIDVDVPPGQTVQVRYRAPWLVFLKGKLAATTFGYGASPAPPPPTAPPARPAPPPVAAVEPVAPAPAPGWFPDPGRRHEHRYWDGAAWTDHVSDRGTTTVDPAG